MGRVFILRAQRRRQVTFLVVAILFAAAAPRLFALMPGSTKTTGISVGTVSPPAVSFANPKTQEILGAAYNDALRNLLSINTVPYTATYNRTGLLADPPGTFIRAGGGYAQPWTRDASVNSWNASSLLEPAVARNTLWAVVQRDPARGLIVQQDNQWWDQSIWIIAAWNHFLITGDREFLANAYETTRHTLDILKKNHFNAGLQLFEGPSFFNDGIAGYPVPPATKDENLSTFVLAYPGASRVIALSTNCIYYEAYRRAAGMGKALARPDAELTPFTEMANSLKAAINQKFWNPRTGLYGYLVVNGVLDQHEEGAGLSLAILFDIADRKMAESIVKNTHVQPHGIVDIYPNFPRYSDSHPGRHNAMVWPMVEGFWAQAAAKSRGEDVFAREVWNLATLDRSTNGHFFEIYNAQTGAPDGGWQSGGHMKSQPDQTWSATAYLRLIYDGLFGMRFRADGLEFQPLLPSHWGDVKLSGLRYRNATLDIRLHGAGSVIRSFKLDGVEHHQTFLPSDLAGTHEIDIAVFPGHTADPSR